VSPHVGLSLEALALIRRFAWHAAAGCALSWRLLPHARALGASAHNSVRDELYLVGTRLTNHAKHQARRLGEDAPVAAGLG
jgi:hypothetical protein